MLKASKTRAEPEDLLLDYAERLTHHRAGRRAVTIALSKLAAPTRPDDHWRLIENLIQPLILRHGGEIFRLGSGDVAVVFTSLDQAMSDRLMLKLRYLFRDDPLIEAEERGDAEPSFAHAYYIAQDYDAFLAYARAVKDGGGAALPATLDDVTALSGDALTDQMPRGPVRHKDPANAPLIAWFKAAPEGVRALHGLAVKAPAVRVRPRETPAIAFEHFEAHFEALAALGLPQADLERNDELTQALRALTQRRLLIELPGALKTDQAIALTVSLDVLLSPEFLSFHRAWALGRWIPATICVPRPEAGSVDVERLRYARGVVRGLGHRLALGPLPLDIYQQRGLNTPARLDADLLIFAFDPRHANPEAAAEAQALRAWLADAPDRDVLLTQVHTREALNFGQSLGVTLFQGRQAAALVGRA